MRITTQNAQGLNVPSKKCLLKNNLKQFESEVIILQEIKLNRDEGIKLEMKLGSWNTNFHDARGASRGLGMIWNPRKVNLNILNSNNSQMSSRIKSLKSNLQLILINIYGPTHNIDKKQLWEGISLFIINHNNELILIGGYFNTITSIDEKFEGNQHIFQASLEFK